MTAVGADEAVGCRWCCGLSPGHAGCGHVACCGCTSRPVAPAMLEQLPPLRSQRRHWAEANRLRAGPRSRVSRQLGVHHRIAHLGGGTFCGRADPAMIGVGFETAMSDPSVFVAVTRTRSLSPRLRPEPVARFDASGWARSSSRPELRRPWDSVASGTRTSLACYRTKCLAWPSAHYLHGLPDDARLRGVVGRRQRDCGSGSRK